MDKQIFTQAITNLEDKIQHINMAVRTTVRRINNQQIKRGIRHGDRKYTNLFDRVYGFCRTPEYGLSDIYRGYVIKEIFAAGNLVRVGTEKKPVEPPTSPYLRGRYVAMGNSLLEFSKRTGDVGAAVEAARVFSWLGQAQRLSVRRKVNNVYKMALATSEKYRVPISDPTDRRSAVLPSAIHYEVMQYLKSTSQNKAAKEC